MSYFRRSIRDFRFWACRLRVLCSVAAVWCLAARTAWAQTEEEGEAGNSYGLSWLLIVLCLGLGLLATLRPTGRSADVKKPLRD